MIVYKVVKKNTNYSCMVGCSKYCTKYEKGSVMEDHNGMGFFCFKTLKAAKSFRINCLARSFSYKIKRIQPLSRGATPKEICTSLSENWLDCFYRPGPKIIYQPVYSTPPLGTICYKKIEVLD